MNVNEKRKRSLKNGQNRPDMPLIFQGHPLSIKSTPAACEVNVTLGFPVKGGLEGIASKVASYLRAEGFVEADAKMKVVFPSISWTFTF